MVRGSRFEVRGFAVRECAGEPANPRTFEPANLRTFEPPLKGKPQRELRLLAGLRRRQLTERVGEGVGLEAAADAAEVVTAEQVEHLADELDAAAAAQAERLA